MVDRADPTGGALELARSAAPTPARRRTTLAAVARPAGEVAGLLLVEVLGSPRARAAALDLARSLARWLAGRRPPTLAGVEATAQRALLRQPCRGRQFRHSVTAPRTRADRGGVHHGVLGRGAGSQEPLGSDVT
jgi:hypothetical protein